MDHKELLKRVDHTLLTPTAAWDQIQKIGRASCRERV